MQKLCAQLTDFLFLYLILYLLNLAVPAAVTPQIIWMAPSCVLQSVYVSQPQEARTHIHTHF